ncbi:UNVERIFIED_CONTAM: hypothetical protein HDU68_002249, partial [Siphonaria sp. JEL0065]
VQQNGYKKQHPSPKTRNPSSMPSLNVTIDSTDEAFAESPTFTTSKTKPSLNRFDQIPGEVIESIFKHLPLDDTLQAVALTCKLFASFITDLACAKRHIARLVKTVVPQWSIRPEWRNGYPLRYLEYKDGWSRLPFAYQLAQPTWLFRPTATRQSYFPELTDFAATLEPYQSGMNCEWNVYVWNKVTPSKPFEKLDWTCNNHNALLLIKALLEDPHCSSIRLDYGLIWASYHGYLAAVQAILSDGRSQSLKNVDVALKGAIYKDHPTIVQLLLDVHGISFEALKVAIKHSRLNYLRMLLKRYVEEVVNAEEDIIRLLTASMEAGLWDAVYVFLEDLEVQRIFCHWDTKFMGISVGEGEEDKERDEEDEENEDDEETDEGKKMLKRFCREVSVDGIWGAVRAFLVKDSVVVIPPLCFMEVFYGQPTPFEKELYVMTVVFNSKDFSTLKFHFVPKNSQCRYWDDLKNSLLAKYRCKEE